MIAEFKNMLHTRKVLLKQERKEYFSLIFYMIIASFLEMISVSLIFAIVMSVLNPKFFFDNNFYIFDFLEIEKYTENNLIIFFLVFFLIIYLFKSGMLIYFYYRINKYVASIKQRLSNSFLKLYTKITWVDFVQKNSSEFIRNIIIETGIFSGAILQTLLIISETIILMGLISLLFYFEFKIMFLITCVISVFSLIIYMFAKKNLKKLSYERQQCDEKRLKNLNEFFNGFKILRIMSKFPTFINIHELNNNFLARIEIIQTTIQQLPKILFELVFMIIIVTFFFTLYILKIELVSILPITSLFIASSFKIIPSINKIINCNLNLKSSIPSVELINKEFHKNHPHDEKLILTETKELQFKNLIELKNVTFKYLNTKRTSIENINLKILKGSQIGIIGESGAGKTTLIDIITGLIEPESGDILCDNKNIHKNLKSWQSKIGYIPQSVFLSDDDIKKNITLELDDKFINQDRLKQSIKDSNLDQIILELPKNLKTRIGEHGSRLSGGQRQRIGIARALYANPEILILDEATSSLDSLTENSIMDTINKFKGKKTVIIISHRESAVKNCDKIFKISNGKIL